MDNMRNRLIELLSKKLYPREGVDIAEVVADYLIDNGVVALPCKVGDTVYFANRGLQEVCPGTVFVIEIDFYTRCRNPIWLKIEYHSKLIGFHEYHCSVTEINNTIFFTQEEAEKALKESESK